MRKLLSVLLVVLLLITATACDPESGTVNDVTFNVSLSYKKAIEAGKDSVAYVDSASKWTYTAVKGDDGYTTGETAEEKELGDGNLGKLSLGTWTITINGYDSKDKLVYTGSVKTDTITADSKVTVDVKPEAGMVKVYSDFVAAVKAATAGDTITLVNDVEVKESVTLDKNLTLDLGGKTVTLAITNLSENGGAFELSKGTAAYSVTVKNGKITGEVKETSASESINKTNAFALYDNSSLTLEGVEMDVKCKRGIQVRDLCKNVSICVKNSTLKVKDGIDGVYVIATNASVESGSTSDVITIDISGSTLEASSVENDKCGSTALLLNVPGNYTITNSNIKGERQAAIFRGGTYTVSGSKFEYTTNNSTNKGYESTAWKDGNDVPNAAIVIGNRYENAYKYKTDVTFSGTNTLTVPTSGGYQLYVYQNSNDEKRTVTVKGDIEPSWMNNSDMNGATYPVAKVGSECKTGDLQTVINNATDESEIELCKDVSEVFVINGKKLTLDFNGHTISGGIGVGCENNGYYSNDPEGGASTVVFKDSGSNGGVVNTVANNAALAIKGESKVTIEGGSFIYDGSSNSSMVILLDNSTLDIYGGSVENRSTGSYGYCVEVDEYYYGKTTANIHIHDGEFSTCAASWGYLIYVHDKKSTLNLTIDGGEYDTKGTWGYLASKPSVGKIVVNDGIFRLGKCGQVFDVMNTNYSGYDSGTPVSEEDNIEINGGVFTIGEGTNPEIRGFVYCNNTTDNVYGYVPKSLKLNGGKINCGTIHKKILEESNCELVQDTEDTSYYIVTPKTTD